MTVQDVKAFDQGVVIVVNSDIAASQLVADRLSAMYSIPTANQYVVAAGLDREWAYSATRYEDFYAPLAAHMESVGATAVFCAAGCPITTSVVDHTTEVNIPGTSKLSFPLMCSMAKRIAAMGYEPRCYISADTLQPTMKFGGALLPDVWDPAYQRTISQYDYVSVSNPEFKDSPYTTRYNDIIEAYVDADYEAAITAIGGNYSAESRRFVRYKSADIDFSILDNLPCGWVGWWDGLETDARDAAGTYSTNIWDRSRIILGKSSNAEGRVATVKDRKVLVSILGAEGNPSTSMYFMASKWALIVKKLIDLGFTDVDYWYVNKDVEPAMYEQLAPVAAGKQEVLNGGWTTALLDLGLLLDTRVDYSYGFGFGFGNSMETTWAPNMTAISPHALFIGGASSNDKWAAKLQTTDLGHSAIVQPYIDTGGRHATTITIRYEVDMVIALLSGITLAEAAFLGPEFYVFPIGNPLCRPFVI
jgi:hypothetical protein